MIPPEEHPSWLGRPRPTRDTSGGTMPKTLLLADDSVTIQKVVGISFANEDVRLITVDNGDDAIARARQERPDLILADVVMPGKSGYEVCEAIKADPNLRHIPVLLLTGTFEAFDEARAARVGAAGHVAKPFESQPLVDTGEAAARPERAAAQRRDRARRRLRRAARREGRLRRQLRVLQRRSGGAGRARGQLRRRLRSRRERLRRSRSATPRAWRSSRRRPRGRGPRRRLRTSARSRSFPTQSRPPPATDRGRSLRGPGGRRGDDDAGFEPLEAPATD